MTALVRPGFDLLPDGSESGRAVELSGWWRDHRPDPGDAVGVAKTFDAAVRDGLLDLPHPSAGGTLRRWAELAWWGATETSLARLVEGHADATAILAELGAAPLPQGTSSAVWAAEPPGAGVRAEPVPQDGWRLTGRKAWCSGASICDTALLTVEASDGPRLMLADLRLPGVHRPAPTWQGSGMAASDTETVEFDAVPAHALGSPGGYLNRPGFWIGGIGVAAVWWGAALAAARPLRSAVAKGRADAHAQAHLGRVRVLLSSTAALLREAAAAVDARPGGDHEVLAQTVRAAVADGATEVLDRVGRALGPGPLATDHGHAQRVADLTVFLRQHHAERDLARLGELDPDTVGW